MKYKEGDWVYYDFKLCQIKEIEDGIYYRVTDGFFQTSGSALSDSFFPLDLRIKSISDEFKYHSDLFHKLSFNALNHPDINRKLVSMWIEACNNKDDNEKIGEIYDKLHKFYDDVKMEIEKIRMISINDVKLIRQ